MNRAIGVGIAAAVMCVLAALEQTGRVKASGGPAGLEREGYRVLAPIESGNLLLFPVVKGSEKSIGATPFLTLDEGIRSGQVEVTEAGNVRGLVRPRPGSGRWTPFHAGGDQVNTLVLVNNSDRPLLLLAGEIVTGGKQDRVIAKDRIVPPGSDPIDLSVFCIEPGRWVETSPTFGDTAKSPAESFMAQPTVRQQAMVAKDQQQVWDSVHGSIAQIEAAPVASGTVTVQGGAGGGVASLQPLNTTSYAKAMQNGAISAKVDEAAAPVMKSRDQVLARLKQEQAVGVVVAVRGELVWADLFADTDLLSRYWTKLVRSYAAESLTEGEEHAAPTVADAQRFLEMPRIGMETSEGEVGVYRYSELKTGGSDTFVLESLLPGASYDVHISRVKVKGEHRGPRPGIAY
jgi:hypothetical protein